MGFLTKEQFKNSLTRLRQYKAEILTEMNNPTICVILLKGQLRNFFQNKRSIHKQKL